MKNRTMMGVSVALIFIALFFTTFFGNVAMAYYGGYGGYWGCPSFGLSSLYNPMSFYSYGSGLSNLLYSFDPLGDSLLGLGMFSFAF